MHSKKLVTSVKMIETAAAAGFNGKWGPNLVRSLRRRKIYLQQNRCLERRILQIL